MSMTVYRVQDHTGRGPWRPGFSRRWCDADGAPHPPPFWEDFGWSMASIPYRFFPGEYTGAGCRTLAQLARWFTPRERRALDRYGYNVVAIEVDRIVGESATQVVVARCRPLTDDAIVVPWSALGDRER